MLLETLSEYKIIYKKRVNLGPDVFADVKKEIFLGSLLVTGNASQIQPADAIALCPDYIILLAEKKFDPWIFCNHFQTVEIFKPMSAPRTSLTCMLVCANNKNPTAPTPTPPLYWDHFVSTHWHSSVVVQADRASNELASFLKKIILEWPITIPDFKIIEEFCFQQQKIMLSS